MDGDCIMIYDSAMLFNLAFQLSAAAINSTRDVFLRSSFQQHIFFAEDIKWCSIIRNMGYHVVEKNICYFLFDTSSFIM
jgi:hypothetical protein